jgi:ABC-type nitrate/sulfonate/bicarbonate transport system substrate-binding protein
LESRRHFCKTGLATTLLTLSCSQRDSKKDERSNSADRIRFQAAWYNDAEFTGHFAAMDSGYYREENLDLQYSQGGPEVIPEGTLLADHSDIALTTPDTTINLIIKEQAPLRIIGAQFQISPLGIVSLRKNNINKPQDLRGKTLAVPPVNITSVDALL